MQSSHVYKIIIFEGADCSGKSTLKRAFEKNTNYRHLCIDRMFITSIVYNRIFKRHADIDGTLIGNLVEFSYCLKPVFIYVNTPIDVLWKRIRIRGDDMLDSKEKVTKIYNEYKKIFKELENLINVITIDGSKNIDKITKEIINGICKQSR